VPAGDTAFARLRIGERIKLVRRHGEAADERPKLIPFAGGKREPGKKRKLLVRKNAANKRATSAAPAKPEEAVEAVPETAVAGLPVETAEAAEEFSTTAAASGADAGVVIGVTRHDADFCAVPMVLTNAGREWFANSGMALAKAAAEHAGMGALLVSGKNRSYVIFTPDPEEIGAEMTEDGAQVVPIYNAEG
jgi:hypothetical protein